MTEADRYIRELREKEKEKEEKKEIIERLRKKAKKTAEKIGDFLAEELLKEIDDVTIEELKEMEEEADDFLNGSDVNCKKKIFGFLDK